MRNWNGAMERFPEVEDVGVDVDMVGARHGKLHDGFVVVEEEGANVLHIVPGGSGLDEFFSFGMAQMDADMIPARAFGAVGMIFPIGGHDDVMRVKLDSLPAVVMGDGKHAPGGPERRNSCDWVGDSEWIEMGKSGFHWKEKKMAAVRLLGGKTSQKPIHSRVRGGQLRTLLTLPPPRGLAAVADAGSLGEAAAGSFVASHSRSFNATRLNGQKMTLGIDTAMLGGIGRAFVPRHEALFAA